MCISCDLDRPVLYLLCLSTGFVETIKLLVRTAYNNDTHHNTNIVSLYLSAKTVPYKNDSVDCQKEIAKRKAPGLQSNALPLSYKCFIVAPNVSRTRDHSKINLWRYRGSNPGLSACKADALPLCHTPFVLRSHLI